MSPADLRKALDGPSPPVVLDVREEGVFGQGHLFYAAPLPLSRLELGIVRLAPRKSIPIVLCDEAGVPDGPAARAGKRLAGFGYGDLRMLAGGAAGWREAGYELYSGMNVPSKAFGEFVEHTYGTQSLDPEELRELADSGRPLVILDSRPMGEYSRMNIPGGINVPGAELVYRVHDLAPDPETLVVVNCAGRTRSIIGAQSLVNAGIPNPVRALRNGTMGWHLAGLTLERGQSREGPTPSAGALERAREAAARVAARFGVPTVSPETLAQWEAEAGERTLYLYDVRVPEEYEAGHLAGARNAPGGQLVQATDTYMADRTARVVLVDREGVRAVMTASWLIQMGWKDVSVLESWPPGREVVTGPFAEDIPGLGSSHKTVEPGELAAALEGGADAPVVVDLAPGSQYRKGHIPGARFAIRSRLAEARSVLPVGRPLVLTSPDGVLARLAAPEAAALGWSDVRVLRGGTEAWANEGRGLETGEGHMVSEPVDEFPKPYDYDGGVEERMREYLTWEVNLVEQIERGKDVSFRAYSEGE